MSNIETLQERIEKAEAKVEKCKGTIERHKKALDKKIQRVIKEVGIDLTGKSLVEVEEIRDPFRGTDHSWTLYEVEGKLKDIKGAEKKLKEAEAILGNWQEKLSVAVNEDKFIQDNAPRVLKDFLEEWKKMAFDWHVKRYDDYQEFKKKIDKEVADANIQVGVISGMMPSKSQREQLKEMKLDWESVKSRKAQFAGGSVLYMDSIYNEEERLAWLEKTLELDKKMKLLDLCYRISKTVGEVVDASELKINQKGNLDGIIIGDKGKARLETIGAGGYNIVCFHYRTLIKPIK